MNDDLLIDNWLMIDYEWFVITWWLMIDWWLIDDLLVYYSLKIDWLLIDDGLMTDRWFMGWPYHSFDCVSYFVLQQLGSGLWSSPALIRLTLHNTFISPISFTVLLYFFPFHIKFDFEQNILLKEDLHCCFK